LLSGFCAVITARIAEKLHGYYLAGGTQYCVDILRLVISKSRKSGPPQPQLLQELLAACLLLHFTKGWLSGFGMALAGLFQTRFFHLFTFFRGVALSCLKSVWFSPRFLSDGPYSDSNHSHSDTLLLITSTKQNQISRKSCQLVLTRRKVL
jgi:hypothetical protein